MKTKTPEEITQAIADQKALCDDKGYPHFGPDDGRCYNCRSNVYQNYPYGNGGISYGKSGKELVTGCPHCHISYCE